jgi:putative sigma-54 modulation protein
MEEVAVEDEEKGKEIVKSKKFNIKPMTADEAILQMELVEHDFFVFKDADTNNINVIYKRKDGNYGILEPDYA